MKKTISDRTIRRRLQEAGYFYLVKEELQELSQASKEKRLAYARKRLNLDWKDVLFRDEKLSSWVPALIMHGESEKSKDSKSSAKPPTPPPIATPMHDT